jgi:hypothetical protein
MAIRQPEIWLWHNHYSGNPNQGGSLKADRTRFPGLQTKEGKKRPDADKSVNHALLVLGILAAGFLPRHPCWAARSSASALPSIQPEEIVVASRRGFTELEVWQSGASFSARRLTSTRLPAAAVDKLVFSAFITDRF